MSTRNALQVRAAVLSHYDDVAKRLGLSPPLMLRKVGLTRGILSTPTQLIPVDSAVGLLELTAEGHTLAGRIAPDGRGKPGRSPGRIE